MRQSVEPRIPGLVLALLGVGFCVGGVSYGVILDGRMGPGLVPMVAGVALLTLGAALMVAGVAPVTGPQAGEAAETGPDDDRSATQLPAYPGRPWIILGSVVVVLVATRFIGLLPALGAMTFLLILVVERLSWRVALGSTVATVTVSWLIFVHLLGVPLPGGILAGS